jgi:4-alpha-glucanotransferase
MTASQTEPLQELARLYGVQTTYDDVDQKQQQANQEALLAVLRCLGAPVERLDDVPEALRERRLALWRDVLEPAAVAWEGKPLRLEVRLPSSLADAALTGNLTLESGEKQTWQWPGADLPVRKRENVEGQPYLIKSLPLPEELPQGYHKFTLELPGGQAEMFIISAPARARGGGDPEARSWGVFLPTYALHTHESWGSGDFSNLEELIEWVASIGGDVAATLPLLAAFLDEPFEPSPYTPSSRLLWNAFYVDVRRAPELPDCPQGQAVVESPAFRKELDDLRSQPLVDYRRQMSLKRSVLEELAKCCFARDSDRLQDLTRFAGERPEVEDYARFRAASEKYGASWQSWPEPLRQGELREGDYNEHAKRYHLYAQWLADQQLQGVSETARRNGVRLYLDLPLGVHPEGYDVWRNQSLFVQEASGGAPPDTFFRKGQNWAFPPLHPDVLRRQSYDYVIACLRHSLKHAGILRVDHVMSLHRLFWIPRGMEASRGVYVRYPADELYAILALESHRNKAVIVGEDLGTVPPEVGPAMARHGLHRMYVVQYALNSNSRKALPPVRADVVASLNTHDMLPFASFWQGLDIQEQCNRDSSSGEDGQGELRLRDALRRALVSMLRREGWMAESSPTDALDVLGAVIRFLSASPARTLLVNLEDLWLETEAQNVPGTQAERPNWRRKARYALDEFRQLPQVIDTLSETDRNKRRKP